VVAESLAAAERATPALLLGGRDLASAQALATELGGGAQAAACDVFDATSLAAFCERADVVVNCAGPYTRVLDRVARAAHAAGAHYVDPGGAAATYRRLERLAPEIAATSRSFVLGAGLIEGGTGLIAWYASAVAQATFDEVSSLDLYFGDLEEWSRAASEDILSDAFDDEALGWYRGGCGSGWDSSVRCAPAPASTCPGRSARARTRCRTSGPSLPGSRPNGATAAWRASSSLSSRPGRSPAGATSEPCRS
jgi:hypothetical protein